MVRMQSQGVIYRAQIAHTTMAYFNQLLLEH